VIVDYLRTVESCCSSGSICRMSSALAQGTDNPIRSGQLLGLCVIVTNLYLPLTSIQLGNVSQCELPPGLELTVEQRATLEE